MWNNKQQQHNAAVTKRRFELSMTTDDDTSSTASPVLPQVFATGYSNDADMLTAISKAVGQALEQLPPDQNKIDLAIITLSSLYDNQSIPMSTVIPTLLDTASVSYGDIKAVIGATAGGIVSSTGDAREKILESEGIMGVSVTLAQLPDVDVHPFHVFEEDVPDDVSSMTEPEWRSAMSTMPSEIDSTEEGHVFLLPSPSFQPTLNDLLQGMSNFLPNHDIFGGIVSTVSSLSRARLFLYDSSIDDPTNQETVYNSGCIGLSLQGDIEINLFTAQGAKPVGDTYRIMAGKESTIHVIAPEEDEHSTNAGIPKPTLAYANQLIKQLGDDNASFMRKALLIGLEQESSIPQTFSQLQRLKNGDGHKYLVHQVASAGMKDGSVTFSLGAVNIQRNTKMRFFVRESSWCQEEVEALWMGYTKKMLERNIMTDSDSDSSSNNCSPPTHCMMLSTMDRGSKLFGSTYKESLQIHKYLPTVTSVSGFYGNGVLATLDGAFQISKDDGAAKERTLLHASASTYAIFRSKTQRPIYNSQQPQSEQEEEAVDDKTTSTASAPRQDNGELVLRRREVHSGRALTVSTVQWSVAENQAQPTSKMEEYMWDKETEVDRFRERVPLANLLSQVKLAMVEKKSAASQSGSSRDWLQSMLKDSNSIVPTCQRLDPASSNPLHQRYDVSTLAQSYNNATTLCVYSDQILFGGQLEDVSKIRKAMPNTPILSYDLFLYPYQFYQHYLAGADAVMLTAGVLEPKDLMYLLKIGKSLGFQIIVSVTSEVQLQQMMDYKDNIDGILLSNRNLETFQIDETGAQAMQLLKVWNDTPSYSEDSSIACLMEGRTMDAEAISKLTSQGVQGVLVSEGWNDKEDNTSRQTTTNSVFE